MACGDSVELLLSRRLFGAILVLFLARISPNWVEWKRSAWLALGALKPFVSSITPWK